VQRYAAPFIAVYTDEGVRARALKVGAFCFLASLFERRTDRTP
jgi:hypothetical protein